MAITKITTEVIEDGAITSAKLGSGSISASSLTGITTDNVSEGSTNVYYTDTRARGSVSVTGGGISYDSGTGVIQIASIPNASLANSSVTINSNSVSLGSSVTLDTDDIGEGSTNLYFTNERVDDRVASLLTAGTGITLTYNDVANTLTIAGSAQYGDSDVESYLSGGTGVTFSSGVISIGQDVGTSSTPTFGNITTTGYIAGPATFTIDPAAVGDNTGTVVIAGNLQVDGTTTTINSTTVNIDDLNIQLATGAINAAAANGAGITVDGASATITYDATNDEWDFNKNVNVTGTITASGTITGTLATAAQTNITSVGTLSALTVTGEIAANGGIALGDDDIATFGNSDDLKIYHVANSSSYIENFSGNLIIRNQNDNADILIQTDDGAGGYTTYIQADGSNGEVRLYHYNSEKFNTSSTGVEVTGSITASGTATLDNLASIQGLDTGNPSASTDEIRVSGYGILGNRGTFYITNGGGSIQIGNGSTHNASPTAVFDTTGLNMSSGKTIRMNSSTKIDASGNLVNIGTISSGNITVSDSSPLITLTDSDVSLSARINGASGNLYLNSHNVNRDVYIGEQGTGNVNMTILGDGNVGIGTTVPLAQLEIDPPSVDTPIFAIRRQDHATIPLFKIFQDSSVSQGTGHCHVNTNNRDLSITTDASSTKTNGIYIATGGNVGIRSVNPQNNLHVDGADATLRVGPYYPAVDSSADRDFILLTAGGSVSKITTTNETFEIENTSGNIDLDAGGNYVRAIGGSFVLDNGTTAQRGGSPYSGTIRFNTDIDKPELYDGTNWQTLGYQTDVTDGLVAKFYGSQNISGTTITSTNGSYTGTFSTTPTLISDVPSGAIYTQSWDVSSSVYCRGNNNFSILSTGGTQHHFSVAHWIKFDSLPVPSMVTVIDAGTDATTLYRWEMQSASSQVEFGIKSSPDFSETTNLTLSTNTWYHIVFTYDDANQKVYINNQLVNTTAFTAYDPATNTAQRFQWNGRFGGGINANSSIDARFYNIRYYNRALTGSEVTTLYTNVD